MRVRFNPEARAQLIAARNYIRERNPSAAASFRAKVEKRLRQLASFPHIGHPIPEAPDDRYRQILVDRYRFFYRIDGETVWIVAVWHGTQLPAVPASL